jgi:two-component system OmpR family response regulator
VPWILIVDDDPQVCDVLTEALRTVGHEARGFLHGSDALEALESAPEIPQLVILDLFLPHMSGRELLKRIRTGSRAPNVPVLVITGMDVAATDLEPWPIAHVMRKPVAIDDLLAAVAAALVPPG